MANSLQLTDDGIQTILNNLVKFLEYNPVVMKTLDGEGYDWLSEFIYQELEPYSNGYVNYN